jgi:hypothetical protein
MMGERRVDQGALFYEFSLERHVPTNHPPGRPCPVFLSRGRWNPTIAISFDLCGALCLRRPHLPE